MWLNSFKPLFKKKRERESLSNVSYTVCYIAEIDRSVMNL